MASAMQSHTKGIVKVLKVHILIPRNGKVCMYPKDVQRVMGKTYTQARLYLKKIKAHLNKEDHQLVSVQEFCDYSGLPIEEVTRSIVG